MITKHHIAAYRDRPRVLVGAEDYMYLLPHPGLRGWISNYTVTFPAPGIMSDGYAVVPHGCATLVLMARAASVSARLIRPLYAAGYGGAKREPLRYAVHRGVPARGLLRV